MLYVEEIDTIIFEKCTLDALINLRKTSKDLYTLIYKITPILCNKYDYPIITNSLLNNNSSNNIFMKYCMMYTNESVNDDYSETMYSHLFYSKNEIIALKYLLALYNNDIDVMLELSNDILNPQVYSFVIYRHDFDVILRLCNDDSKYNNNKSLDLFVDTITKIGVTNLNPLVYRKLLASVVSTNNVKLIELLWNKDLVSQHVSIDTLISNNVNEFVYFSIFTSYPDFIYTTDLNEHTLNHNNILEASKRLASFSDNKSSLLCMNFNIDKQLDSVDKLSLSMIDVTTIKLKLSKAVKYVLSNRNIIGWTHINNMLSECDVDTDLVQFIIDKYNHKFHYCCLFMKLVQESKFKCASLIVPYYSIECIKNNHNCNNYYNIDGIYTNVVSPGRILIYKMFNINNTHTNTEFMSYIDNDDKVDFSTIMRDMLNGFMLNNTQ